MTYLGGSDSTGGVSQPVAVLLLVAITFLLALLLMFQMPKMDWEEPPSFLEIVKVTHADENGVLKNVSLVKIYHHGTERLVNDNLKPVFYRNGEKLDCRISTLNGHKFISTVHLGVSTIAGSGCKGVHWDPGEDIEIDFSNGTFHPGDIIRMDVMTKVPSIIISRHTYHA